MSKSNDEIMKEFQSKLFIKSGELSVEAYVDAEDWLRAILATKDQRTADIFQSIAQQMSYFPDDGFNKIDLELIATKFGVTLDTNN